MNNQSTQACQFLSSNHNVLCKQLQEMFESAINDVFCLLVGLELSAVTWATQG